MNIAYHSGPDVPPARVALIFIDGFGWGIDDAAVNPLVSYGGRRLLLPAPPPIGTAIRLENGAWACPLDACLGIDGLPQSATGQATLLTGINAAVLMGRHQSGFPGAGLRKLILEHSLLRHLRAAGLSPVFFNAFRPPFFTWPRERQLRMSATTIANLAADLPFFDVPDIAAGRALYQDFTGEELHQLGFVEAPLLTSEEAGACLARNLPRYDFLLYEYFSTDKAGHTADRAMAEAELWRLDTFLGALLANLPADTLLLWCSDHGNLEDLSVTTHTRNSVALMAWGAGAKAFVTGLVSIHQVAPAILRTLSADEPRRPGSRD